MYFKKCLSCMAILLTVSVFLTACGGIQNTGSADSPAKSDISTFTVNDSGALTDKKVTLRIFAARGGMHSPFEEMQVLNDMEAETNVHIEWIEPGGNTREKINLLFASSDLPDVFLGGINDTDIMQHADSSLLALDTLIDKNAPNLKVIFGKDPEAKKKLTHPNGHIYSTPSNTGFIGNSNPDNLYINKKWLDKLNMKVPTTTDEFYTVLRAFKDKDPNGNGKQDEIPFSPMIGKGILVDIFSMFGSFGSPDNPAHLAVENNKVIFTAAQPGYKEGIIYFAKLYTEKLLDPDCSTQNGNQQSAKAKAATPVIGSALTFLDENLFGTERARNEYTHVLPLKGPNGYQMWNNYDNAFSRTGNGCATVTTANKNPDITMRWIDRWYSEKWSLQSFWGHVGTVISQDDKGKFVIKDAPEGMTQDEFRFKSTAVNITPFYLSRDFTENKLVLTMDQARKTERSKEYSKYFPKQILPKFFLTVEQDNEKAAISAELNAYVNQMKSRWITGNGSIQAEWDDYIKTLDKLGVGKYVKMHQDLYDTYNTKK